MSRRYGRAVFVSFVQVAVLLATAPTAAAAAYTVLDLGTLGGSYIASNGFGTVNSSGQTVGMATTAGNTSSRAFFDDVAGAMQDLNDLIPAGSGWELQEAHGINDLGQIA